MTGPTPDPHEPSELADLIAGGRWRTLEATARAVLLRPHDSEYNDTLVIGSPTDAMAERTNPMGIPVWRTTGTLADVIAALAKLPDPGQAGAPIEPIGANPNVDRM